MLNDNKMTVINIITRLLSKYGGEATTALAHILSCRGNKTTVIDVTISFFEETVNVYTLDF